MSAARRRPVRDLGEIVEWPGGYAMTIGTNGSYTVPCCSGHPTPEDAKNHGLAEVVLAASAVADRDIALWAAKTEAAS